MRTDVLKIPFAAATTGTVVAVVEVSDTQAFAVGIAESAVGGTVTAHGYDAILSEGADDLSGGDSYGTADLGATAKKAMVTRSGTFGVAKTTLLPNLHALSGAARLVKVVVWVTGGGNATGSVYVFKKQS